MSCTQAFLKRLFDIAASIIGIAAAFIPAVIAACCVKLSSRGPALFVQKRVGRHGELFTCCKFRTMSAGAEKRGSVTAAGDGRITTVGRFLRRYKLDEYPQLVNVLIGNMSFVGPRPDVPGYADKLEGDDRRILEIRPGITGPASIFFRNEEELLTKQSNPKAYNDNIIWPVKVAINKIYLDKWGFFQDIGYILITVVPALDRVFHLMERFAEFRESII